MDQKSIDTKLYIGNLPYTTTEQELRQMFAKAGRVTSVDLILDQASGRSKGFAFVTMETPAEAQRAIGMFQGTQVAGRTLTVNLTRKREAPAGYQSRLGAFGPAASRPQASAPSGYQSRYSAFGDRNVATQPRRRGGSQRH